MSASYQLLIDWKDNGFSDLADTHVGSGHRVGRFAGIIS